MLKGIFYTAISKYSNVLLTIIISAILARLLTPAEFGIVALVSVFIAFFSLLGNMGIGPAIVQVKELTDLDLSSIFSFSVFMAFFLALAFFLSSDLIANFYNEQDLVPIVRLLSISVFFNILSIVPNALNRKKLRFKEMAVVNILIQVTTGLIAIFMAFNGYSYYSLVIQSVLSGFLGFLIFYLLYPVKISFLIRKEPLRKIASFSSFQFAFNFINYFSRNLDNILIGKYLGNASLGFYNKSYTLMLLPVRNLTHVITPVLHPVLSNHQDDKKYIFNSYCKIIKILALLGFPLSVFLYFAASELILIMFGPQWEASIPVFKILATTVGIQICLSSTGAIFQSVNRTDLLFISGLLSSFFAIVSICIGVFYGKTLEYLGYCLVVAFILNFFQGFYILIKNALGESFITFLKGFIFPIFISAILLGIMILLQHLPLNNYLLSFIFKITSLVIVLILAFLLSKDERELINKILKNNKKR